MTPAAFYGNYRFMSVPDETVMARARGPAGSDDARRFDDGVRIIAWLREDGFEALFAGGCVRDWCRAGRSPVDLDIATSAPPDAIVATMRRRRAAVQEVGKHFGVVRVRPGRESAWYEVATFREDGTYSDARHPDSVVWSTRPKDAARRDFTVNGLYFDPFDACVHDHVGGRADIDARLIRAIGEPELRFREDALRLLRAVRFAAREGFTIEPGTSAAMRLHAHLLRAVAPERIRDELVKMAVLDTTRRVAAFRDLVDTGLADVLWDLLFPQGWVRPDDWARRVSEHLSEVGDLPDGSLRLSVFLAAWIGPMSDVAPPWSTLADRLKRGASALRLSVDESELLTALVAAHRRMVGRLPMDAFRLRRCAAHPLRPWIVPYIRAAFPTRDEWAAFGELAARIAPVPLKPLIDGNALRELGVPPGPALGRWTRWLLVKQYRGEFDGGQDPRTSAVACVLRRLAER